MRQLAIGDCTKKVFSTIAKPSTGNLVISARSGDREDAIHSVCKDDIVVYLVQFNVRGTVSLVRGATEALAAIDVILLTNFKSVADVTRPVGPLGADLRVAPCVRHRYSGVDAFGRVPRAFRSWLALPLAYFGSR